VKLAFGYKSDVGRKRSNNQDSFVVLERADLGNRLDGLMIIADGMGGMGGGEVASGIVVRTLPEAVGNFLVERSGSQTPIDTVGLLRDAISRANDNVRHQRLEREEYSSMGTTCVAAIVNDDMLTIGNLGDSRAYLLRNGELRQITEDHSLVWQEVKAGRMTPEQARHNPFRNQITQGIGLNVKAESDVGTISLTDGDTVLLCSDGLTTEVPDSEIAYLLASAPEAQTACDLLVQLALDNGGSDNVTAIVLRCGFFVPLAPLPNFDRDREDEDPTDTHQNWRSETRPSVGEHTGSGEDAWSSLRSRSVTQPTSQPMSSQPIRNRGIHPAVTFALLTVAIAEGVLLGALWLNRHPSAAESKPPSSRPTLLPAATRLVYDKPIGIYSQLPLWGGCLQIEPSGNLLVVGISPALPGDTEPGQPVRSGHILRLTPGGSSLSVVTNGYELPALPAREKRVDGTLKPPKVSTASPVLVLDSVGNRYQLLPAKKVIEKYSPDGVRVNDDIGSGFLTAPENIAVDSKGSIYVIDNLQLKKITAHEPAAAAIPPAQ